jgi:hypothetical protein
VSRQPEEYLDVLLPCLAPPAPLRLWREGSPPALAPIRAPGGEVLALRSGERQYPVVNNVPCLLPDPGERKRGTWRRWEALLSRWCQAFGGQPGEEPSAGDDPVAACVGRKIGRSAGGLVLDVGCGTLSLPPHVDACRETVDWIGIDPVLGGVARRFPFVQGLGEHLPFRSGVFDGALYSLVLSNLLDPLQSMRQTWCEMGQTILAKVPVCLHNAAISAETVGLDHESAHQNLRKDPSAAYCTGNRYDNLSCHSEERSDEESPRMRPTHSPGLEGASNGRRTGHRRGLYRQ